MDDLKKNLDYYIEHQQELVNQYNNRILLIHDQKVVGAFDNRTDAYFEAKDRFEPRTYSIIKCTPGEEEYTVNYRTRNRFSRMSTKHTY